MKRQKKKKKKSGTPKNREGIMANEQHETNQFEETGKSESLIVTVTDEDGVEQTFQLVQTIEVDGNSNGATTAYK